MDLPGAPGIKFALGENVKQSNWGDNFTSRYPQTRMGVEQRWGTPSRRPGVSSATEIWEQTRGGMPRVDLELEALAEVLARHG